MLRPMIELRQALSLMSELTHDPWSSGRELELEQVAFEACVGRVLGEAARAPQASPAADYSAMDGYAVCADDLEAASPTAPVVLELVGADYADAGLPSDTGTRVARAQVRGVATGAPIPAGADAVVRREQAELRRDAQGCEQVVFRKPVARGADIRRAGEQHGRGAVLLPAGRVIEANDLPALALLDRSELTVLRRPRVAIFVVGDELRAPGESTDARVIDCNGPWLAAQLAGMGVELVAREHLGDDPDQLGAALKAHAKIRWTFIIGGSSVGERDHARAAAVNAGGRAVFEGIAMRPGRPVALYARADGSGYIACLPGNPTAFRATFMVVFADALFREAGRGPWPRLGLRAAHPLPASPRFAGVWRGRQKGCEVDVPEGQNSGAVTVLPDSHGWVVIPPRAASHPAGTILEFIPDLAGIAAPTGFGLVPDLAFVGAANSGKTTVLERIIAELPELRIAVLKHSHHQLEFHPSTSDGARMLAAGAFAVSLAHAGGTNIEMKLAEHTGRAQLVALLARVGQFDAVFVEGFKTQPGPKVEVHRRGQPRLSEAFPNSPAHEIVAVLSDDPELVQASRADCPHFDSASPAGLEAFSSWLVAWLRTRRRVGPATAREKAD